MNPRTYYEGPSVEREKEGTEDAGTKSLYDVDWATEWVQRPEIAARIQREFPEVAKRPNIGQALEFMVDHEDVRSDILPPAFFAIIDLSYLTDGIMDLRWKHYGTHSRIAGDADLSKGITTEGKRELITDHETNKSYYRWKLHSDAFATEFTTWTFCNHTRLLKAKEYENVVCQLNGKFIPAQNEMNKDLDSLLSTLLDAYRDRGFWLHAPPYQRIHFIPDQEVEWMNGIYLLFPKSFRLEQMRKIMLLGAYPELQVQETFSFYQKNFHLLQEEGHRELFKRLVFSSGLFLEHLDRNPEENVQFVDQISKFCKNGFRVSSHVNDLPTTLFYLEINRFFADYVNYALKEYPERFTSDFKPDFINTRDEIHRYLSSSRLSSEKRTAFLVLLMRSYENRDELPIE